MILTKENNDGNHQQYESLVNKFSLASLGIAVAATAATAIYAADDGSTVVSLGLPMIAFLGTSGILGSLSEMWSKVSAGFTTSELDVTNSTLEEKKDFFETDDDTVVIQKLAEAVSKKSGSGDITTAGIVSVSLAL